jgi:hypothetical protein
LYNGNSQSWFSFLKHFIFTYFFPVLFQIATFEIQRLKYQLVEVVKEEEGGMEGGGGGGGWLEGG